MLPSQALNYNVNKCIKQTPAFRTQIIGMCNPVGVICTRSQVIVIHFWETVHNINFESMEV